MDELKKVGKLLIILNPFRHVFIFLCHPFAPIFLCNKYLAFNFFFFFFFDRMDAPVLAALREKLK